MTWSSRPTRPRRPPSAPACLCGIWTASPGTSSPKGDTGVRIEDLALVTEDGVEILNHLPKALEVLP